MIKISKQLWCVKGVDREDALSYMCGYEETKEGNVLSNVAKMQETGRSWARSMAENVYKMKDGGRDYERDESGRAIVDYVKPAQNGEEFIFDNTPTKGFYVGCSVSRWSTSNKLFRVKDPRGFTVEIPTDNLATLLHHTTVVNGVVQEECVWGREGNNHILLPVNSEPYLITLDQMDTLENKLISLKDLKVGDLVKMFDDETLYYYAGKIKGTWKLQGRNRPSYWDRNTSTQYSEPEEVKDDKWTDAFLSEYKYGSGSQKYSVKTFSKPKIVEIVKHEKMVVTTEEYSWYCPHRVKNQSSLNDRWYYIEAELINVEEKK